MITILLFCFTIEEDRYYVDMLPRYQDHSYSTSAKSDFGFFS